MADDAEQLTQFDFLVIGSGIAGLWFAYRAGSHGSVLIVTKKEDSESNTNYAQGGIAAAVAGNDSPELHREDTLQAGQGLVRPAVVDLVTSAGPGLVQELYDVGIEFTTYQDAQGRRQFDLGQEGGHHRRRIVHAKDHTGLEIERGLLKAVRSNPAVTVSERHFAIDLVLDESGRCRGACVLDIETGALQVIRARATMIAAGGIGQAYLHTTNPLIATGDGIAMGYRAGARVANMEFIQFHPTSLHGQLVKGRAFLLSEAMRGEGAILRTRDGKTFMDRYHPDASLAPRDVVARAIDSELKMRKEEHVLLDATHLNPDSLRQRFPMIHRVCLELGIDITREPIPVVPAAHYVCGGLAVDSWSRTSVPGLFAAGESACSGLHGANRLASNSLLEALVFADRAAQRLPEPEGPATKEQVLPDAEQFLPADRKSDADAEAIRQELRGLMRRSAGIVRSDSGLNRALKSLAGFTKQAEPLECRLSVPCLELRNLLAVARLIVASALRRKESRGLHFNKDHPSTNEEFEKDTEISRQELEPASTKPAS